MLLGNLRSELPAELLERAQKASGTGITQTIRTGLQLVAASEAYSALRQMRGKFRFSRTLAELKADRRLQPIRARGLHSSEEMRETMCACWTRHLATDNS